MSTWWKKPVLSLLALAPFALAAAWLAWQAGLLGDWGVESGYYGQFNRVKLVLESMPGVRIENHWQPHDVTLEDFGFDVRTKEDRPVRLNFGEGSPQMRERDTARLRAFIEAEIEKASKP